MKFIWRRPHDYYTNFGKPHCCLPQNQYFLKFSSSYSLHAFGFSAWQLWNISAVNSRGTPLGLEFSSEYISDALPVISFAFQEPENDPRNFTYVWAIRGENDLDSREEKDCLKNNATITLYALAFQNRDDCDAGVLYTGLTACHQRYVECP